MTNEFDEFNNCCLFSGDFYNFDNKGKGGGGGDTDVEIPDVTPEPAEKTRQEEISEMLNNANKNIGIFSSVFGEFVKVRESYINPQQGLDDDLEVKDDEGKKDPKKDDDNKTMKTVLIVGGSAIAIGALVYFVFRNK
jgi:hypothetical protein